jgi:hypothetical protein
MASSGHLGRPRAKPLNICGSGLDQSPWNSAVTSGSHIQVFWGTPRRLIKRFPHVAAMRPEVDVRALGSL